MVSATRSGSTRTTPRPAVPAAVAFVFGEYATQVAPLGTYSIAIWAMTVAPIASIPEANATRSRGNVSVTIEYVAGP